MRHPPSVRIQPPLSTPGFQADHIDSLGLIQKTPQRNNCKYLLPSVLREFYLLKAGLQIINKPLTILRFDASFPVVKVLNKDHTTIIPA